MKRMRFSFFCIVWLFKNYHWADTRQKYKAMIRDYNRQTVKKHG